MKPSPFFAGLFLALAVFSLTSCKDEITTPPTNLTSAVSKDGDLIVPDTGRDNNPNLSAVLAGRYEVPLRVTRGQGVAKFQFNSSRDSLFYSLSLSNISNVVGSSIQRGSPGNTGPVVATLYTAAPGGGPASGPPIDGVLTPADLVGPFAGSVDFNLFLGDIHLDSLYVNVTTDDGVAPPDTGPGDYVSGEIRGQLRSAPYGGIGVKSIQK